MIARRYEIAQLQSDFYREQFRKMVRRIIYCLIIIYVLLGAIVYLILTQPIPRHYANTTEGKILNMPKGVEG